MAGSLEEEMRKEMQHLDKAKQKLLSAVAVYVDPVLRDANVVLHMSTTDTKQCKENIAALKEYSNICYEVEDVLRHKCGDASSISIDIANVSPKDYSIYATPGLKIANPSLIESYSEDVSPNDIVFDSTDIHAPSNRDASGSDSDNSSLVTVLQGQADSNSAQQQTTGKDIVPFTTMKHEAHGVKSVKEAIEALEELDARLESHNISDSSLQPDQRLDENLQCDKCELTGQMLLEAKFQFATSLPIGLDDLFRAADDVLSPLSTLNGEWSLIGNQAEWELDEYLDCFFPRHLGVYAVGVNWQQIGAGILKVSVGTRDRRSGTITQFRFSPTGSRTLSDGEIGRQRFRCSLSSDIGLWVSICRLSFNPKLSDFTLTCQKCPSMEMFEESPEARWKTSVSSKIPFYEG